MCSLIDALPHVFQDLRSLEATIERLTVILNKYQEQPHLLDPYLELIIGKLFELALQDDIPPRLMHLAFKCIYLLSKVRGAKVIVRWFSHEVSDLEPALQLLQNQDKSDAETWETRYVLLLWLYMIIMIPFDLSRLDGSHDHTYLRTINRVVEISKIYLGVADKSGDASVLLCARLLSRPDVQKLKLTEFLDWAFDKLCNTNESTMQGMSILAGVLKTLATLFKISKREELVPNAPKVLEILRQCGFSHSSNTLIRKLNIKLIQRLGTTFLPVRVLSWRYERGSRSLEAALAGSSTQNRIEQKEEEKDDDIDVPEEIEEILGLLLGGIKDKDTVVRWSAAKGIGRITGRLPLEFANEIVGSLLDLFSAYENDGAWHGGCLALAELGRRGLLLPQRLSEVVPVVLKSLVYDESRGSYSVGSHVRDAACYVCWSFARAYDPIQLQPYVEEIARGLVVTMIFDRQVNCRRAASAAFQENVGRQGTFPHGIDILTMADYFSVGNLSHVYLEVSVKVGVYREYTRPLINHLIQHKIQHWDSSLRELVSQALHNLTFLDPSYMKNEVLPDIVKQVTSYDLCVCHGSLHAVSDITKALYEIAKQENSDIETYISEEMIENLKGVAKRLVSADVFKGLSGEIMRPAALKFIEQCCISHIPVTENIVEVWQHIIDENIPHTEEHIRDAAVKSLKVLCEYHYCTDHVVITRSQDSLIPRYLNHLKNRNHFTRMGFSLGLGVLPRPILEGRLDQVLDGLLAAASIDKDIPAVYTEARRDAIRSISNISCTMTLSPDGSPSSVLCQSNINKIFQTLFASMTDYTTDSRGDIGAVVREASMTSMEQLCVRLADECPSLLTPDNVQEIFCLIIQQSNEKIDRTRALACDKLMTLIHHQPFINGIPYHKQLMNTFSHESIMGINWSVAQSSFPLTVQLLNLDSYSYHTLLGLVISVGGLTESLVRYSSSSLLSYLREISSSKLKLDSFTKDIIKVFSNNARNTRVIIPLLKTLDLLLSNGVFGIYLMKEEESHWFPASLLEKLKDEIKNSRDPIKIFTSINTLCSLLQFPSVKEATLHQLMILLGHPYPKVRRNTADQLYVTLLTYDDLISDDIIEQVMSLLSETTWDGFVDSVRHQRNTICSLLNLPIPKAKTGTKTKKKTQTKDSMNYQDLVDRMGY